MSSFGKVLSLIFCLHAGSLQDKGDLHSGTDTKKSGVTEVAHCTPLWKKTPEAMLLQEINKMADYDPRSALELARGAINFKTVDGPALDRITVISQDLEKKLWPQPELNMNLVAAPPPAPGFGVIAPAPSPYGTTT